MHRYLGPGPSLEKMERVALERFLPFYNELESGTDGVVVDLFAWLRTAMTVASTEAIYGPQNPFSHQPELEDALWVWENELTRLLLAPFPSIIARKGFRARSRFIAAMTDYTARKGYRQASDLTKARYHAGVTWGLSNTEIARFEIGSIMGVLVNSTPTLFWLLIHIYSSPQLLADLRAEASSATGVADDGNIKTFTIDIPTFKQKFMLLMSTYQETLRYRTHNAASRMVTQNTLLAGTYFLRAGSIIQMPGACIHSLPSIWGSDHATFNPRRFLKSSTTSATEAEKEKRKLHPGVFRSFGGGTSLCPGRHFATTEICAAAAVFVMRFEMMAVDEKGKECEWRMPAMQVGRITSAVPLPREDVRVRVKTREELGICKWGFTFREGI
ncbi:MAG: hypothetical protein Q9225_000608 [Loekoesia sp. 1 TL-2023]